MKVNPRRIPKTQHDVDKAFERGMEAGSKGSLTIMLYVMQDKFGADESKLKEFADAFNYALDSIAKGYVKESDFESVLKVEYGTIVKVGGGLVSRDLRPMPVGFEKDALEPIPTLVKKYFTGYPQVKRWRSELGINTDLKKAVVQISDGVEVARYDSICEAAKAVHGCPQNISPCVNGRTKKAYGYSWRLADAN